MHGSVWGPTCVAGIGNYNFCHSDEQTCGNLSLTLWIAIFDPIYITVSKISYGQVDRGQATPAGVT